MFDKFHKKRICGVLGWVLCVAVICIIVYVVIGNTKWAELIGSIAGIKESENLDTIKFVINGVSSFFFANVFTVILTVLSVFEHRRDNISEIHLSIVKVGRLRRAPSNTERLPVIKIGEGTYFVIIQMRAQNIGKIAVDKCWINHKELCISQMEENAQRDFYLKVCTNERNIKIISLTITCKHQSATERVYRKAYRLKIDVIEAKASLIKKSKQRIIHGI